MKKSLLALAALSAIAGAAQAQSSVTVYGILDVGFVASHYNGTSAGTVNTANTGTGLAGSPAVNASSASIGQSAESTSRLGFKGNEDLGGGLAAVFTVETALSPNTATSITNSSSSFSFNRQTFVGLKKNGVGTATVGTQYTPIFDVQSITDAAGNNNLVGNAIYTGSLQSSTGTWNTGVAGYTSSGSAPTSVNADSGAYVTRLSNAVKLQSDRFSGLAVQGFYAQSNQSQTNGTGNGNNNNTAFGFNADYVWNKLQVVAAYQSIRAYNGLAALTTAGYKLSDGTANNFGVNDSNNTTYAAATYDFGILKGYLQYITNKGFAVADNNFGTSRSAYQLGARATVTPAIQVYATYGLGKSSYAQLGSAYANFRTMQLGSDYYLSKRTNLYVAYGAFNQSSPNSSAVPGVSSVSGLNYALGIRHTF